MQTTAQSSASPRRSPTSADSFALSGPSNPPDPAFHAYRRDLADVALAGQVIASHFAEPVQRVVVNGAALLSRPADDADPVGSLEEGEPFWMLEDSVGWAWGYSGLDRRVGYVRSEALAPA